MADLDILRALQSPLLLRHAQPAKAATGLEITTHKGQRDQLTRCTKHLKHKDEAPHEYQPSDLVALQNWSELLNRPQEAVILLANYNWQAQLAAAAITIAQDHSAYVIKEDSCCYCVVEAVYAGKTKNPASTVCIA